MNTNHSPLSWHIAPGGPGEEHTILDRDGHPVARVLPYSEPLAWANARLLVDGANHRADLIAALTSAVRALRSVNEQVNGLDLPIDDLEAVLRHMA